MTRHFKKGGQRDPSSHRTPEQIHDMDHGYNHTPFHIHGRVMRNQARRIMEREGRVHKGDGKDVDHHPHMIKDGHATNSPSNLRVRSEHKNRGWERNNGKG